MGEYERSQSAKTISCLFLGIADPSFHDEAATMTRMVGVKRLVRQTCILD